MTLHEVYAICNLCIFGNITRGMLRRILFLHIVSLPRFDGHSSTYGVYLSLFYMCILQRIWRGRLPGVCESCALTTLVIPSRDCPPLVLFGMQKCQIIHSKCPHFADTSMKILHHNCNVNNAVLHRPRTSTQRCFTAPTLRTFV